MFVKIKHLQQHIIPRFSFVDIPKMLMYNTLITIQIQNFATVCCYLVAELGPILLLLHEQ